MVELEMVYLHMKFFFDICYKIKKSSNYFPYKTVFYVYHKQQRFNNFSLDINTNKKL